MGAGATGITLKGSQLFIRNKINKFNLRSIIHSVHVFMHPIIILVCFRSAPSFYFFQLQSRCCISLSLSFAHTLLMYNPHCIGFLRRPFRTRAVDAEISDSQILLHVLECSSNLDDFFSLSRLLIFFCFFFVHEFCL